MQRYPLFSVSTEGREQQYLDGIKVTRLRIRDKGTVESSWIIYDMFALQGRIVWNDDCERLHSLKNVAKVSSRFNYRWSTSKQ